MSERLTGIRLPGMTGFGLLHGWAEWDRKTPAEMIEIYRGIARHAKQQAEEILNAKDEDFYIDTYLGPHAQKKREILQKGREIPLDNSRSPE